MRHRYNGCQWPVEEFFGRKHKSAFASHSYGLSLRWPPVRLVHVSPGYANSVSVMKPSMDKGAGSI